MATSMITNVINHPIVQFDWSDLGLDNDKPPIKMAWDQGDERTCKNAPLYFTEDCRSSAPHYWRPTYWEP